MNRQRSTLPIGRRAGFTLIEVLVVVAIIALLIAILFPALRRARHRSQAVACLANLRQIGLGATMYANESNGYIPPVDPAQRDAGPQNSLAGGWGRYAVGEDNMEVYFPKWGADLALWRCPGAKNLVKTPANLRHTYAQGDSERRGTAYEYNPWMYNIVHRPTSWPKYEWSSRPGVHPIRVDRLKRASRVSIAHDNDNSSDPPARNWYPDGDDPHAVMKGGNMLYADGHARWRRAEGWAEETDGGRSVVRR